MGADAFPDVVVGAGCATVDEGGVDISVFVTSASSDVGTAAFPDVVGAVFLTSWTAEFVVTVFVPAHAASDKAVSRLRSERKEITNLTPNFGLLFLRHQ